MIADQAGVDYTNVLDAIRTDYPRAPGPARPGLRGRPVPVQGHDAARRVHERPLPARPGRDAGQRGPAGLHRFGPGAALRRPRGKTVGILGMAFKAESDDTRASLSYKLRKLLVVGRRDGRLHGPVRRRRPADDPRMCPRGERHPRPRRPAQGVPRTSRSAARTSSTSGAPSVRGSPCDDASGLTAWTATFPRSTPAASATPTARDVARSGARSRASSSAGSIPSSTVLDLACDRGAFINVVTARERSRSTSATSAAPASGVRFVQSDGLALARPCRPRRP